LKHRVEAEQQGTGNFFCERGTPVWQRGGGGPNDMIPRWLE